MFQWLKFFEVPGHTKLHNLVFWDIYVTFLSKQKDQLLIGHRPHPSVFYIILSAIKCFWNTSLSLQPCQKALQMFKTLKNKLEYCCIACFSPEKHIKFVDTGYKIKFKNLHFQYFWFLDLYLNLRLSFTKQQNSQCN